MHPVSGYMSKDLLCIQGDCTIIDAVKIMGERKVGAVLVTGEDQNPIGIFTERDLLTKVNLTDSERLKELKIKDVMTTGLITVNSNEGYTQVIKMMRDNNIRHVPVTEDGKIVGIVSLRDLVRHYELSLEMSLQEKESQLLKNIEEIKASEEKFRTIFSNSAVAITFADAEEKITAWNPLAAKILGMSVGELFNKPLQELYPPEEWQRIRSYDIRRIGGDHHLETKILNKRGELIDVDLSISVLKGTNGQVTGSIGIMHDIRSRKEAEEKLARSRQELQDMKIGLDYHAIVVMTDVEGIITYVNDKFCQISGYSREELLGKDHRMINSKHHTKEYFKDMWDTILAGKVWQGEVRNMRKDKTYYWLESTIVPLLNDQGKPQQFVAIRSDITSRKKYEEDLEVVNQDLKKNAKLLQQIVHEKEDAYRELQETQRQMIQIEKMATLGTLAAGFAHEIKNPLAIILQGMERIEKLLRSQNDEANMQFVNIIKGAANRANRVVTSILRYSRSSQLELAPVNVFEVIEAAIGLAKNNSDLGRIEIVQDYKKVDHLVAGDHIMLQQVFFDLMTNAAHAMPEGGTITIAIDYEPNKNKKEKGRFVIRIKDAGIGIPPKNISKIFDPFFTTKDEGKGTGLGLSTVYLILERHYGTISVESELGKGTVFTICLPVI